MTTVQSLSEERSRAEIANECVLCPVRNLAVCSSLALPELADLDALVQHLHVPDKGTVAHQDEAATAVFSVREGLLRLSRHLRNGRRQIVGFALPGDFIGTTFNDRAGYSIEAIGAVSLCRFERRDFEALVRAKPHLLQRMHEATTHDLQVAHDQVTLIGRRTAEERVAAFLLSMRERWTRVRGASVTVELPMSRTDMADYLGLTIETVSRTISRMARARIILVVPDAVRILDLGRLKAMSGGEGEGTR